MMEPLVNSNPKDTPPLPTPIQKAPHSVCPECLGWGWTPSAPLHAPVVSPPVSSHRCRVTKSHRECWCPGPVSLRCTHEAVSSHSWASSFPTCELSRAQRTDNLFLV